MAGAAAAADSWGYSPAWAGWAVFPLFLTFKCREWEAAIEFWLLRVVGGFMVVGLRAQRHGSCAAAACRWLDRSCVHQSYQ